MYGTGTRKSTVRLFAVVMFSKNMVCTVTGWYCKKEYTEYTYLL